MSTSATAIKFDYHNLLREIAMPGVISPGGWQSS